MNKNKLIIESKKRDSDIALLKRIIGTMPFVGPILAEVVDQIKSGRTLKGSIITK